MRILMILTGGTICTTAGSNGHRSADTDTVKSVMLERLIHEYPQYKDVEIDSVVALNTLSENMTIAKLNQLIEVLQAQSYEGYDAVFIGHGTDTLHITAPLISMLFKGMDIPVFMIVSNKGLEYEEANGISNMGRSLEYVESGIKPGTYVVYRNSDGISYLHKAERLMECSDYSADFFSLPDRVPEVDAPAEKPLLNRIRKLNDSVLIVKPYAGIRYDRYNLDGVKAVLHGTYHSYTLCTEGQSETSAVYLFDKCKEAGIDFYLSPCNGEEYTYTSTETLLTRGACPLYGYTLGGAYAYLLIKYADYY